MADNNKTHADWLDIPDGSGGTQRTWFRDADARAAIEEIEEEISTLDPATYASAQTCEDIISELT